MRYLVKARPVPSQRDALRRAVADGSLGQGSVAFGEYVRNMKQARLLDDGTVCWIESCFCPTPLREEQAFWAPYFSDITTEPAQDPKLCQDANGDAPRACLDCTCTQELEDEMRTWGTPFLDALTD
jgi:hypothetical protein